MTPRKLHVAVALYCYSGNGGYAAHHPSITDWLVKTAVKMKADPRIEAVSSFTLSDTPISMQRNSAVMQARAAGADLLLMIDSDQVPDCELDSDPNAEPFWDSSFDFLYDHWNDGPRAIVAPYCGPPPHENVYVFRFQTLENDAPDAAFRLEQFAREEAAILKGIQPVDAGPTGLCLWDMRLFELTDPQVAYERLVSQGVPPGHAKELAKPWFYYEHPTIYQDEKCSTEDVTATRDLTLHGLQEWGRPVIYCNWSAWAGHMKPKCVRKPRVYPSDAISAKYAAACRRGNVSNRRQIVLQPENARYAPRANGNGDWSPVIAQYSQEQLRPRTAGKHEREGRLANATPEEQLQWARNAPGMSPEEYHRMTHDDFLDREVHDRDDHDFIRVGNFRTPECDLKAVQGLVRSIAGSCAPHVPIIVEVGCFVGETSRAILSAAPEVPDVEHPGEVYAGVNLFVVDTFEGAADDPLPWDDIRRAHQRFRDNQERIRVGQPDNRQMLRELFTHNTMRWARSIGAVEATSLSAAGQEIGGNRTLAMVYLDADHGYEAVRADILAWAQRVKDASDGKDAGFLAGHDYGTAAYPGVTRAVDELLPERVVVHVDGQPTTVWACRMSSEIKDRLRRISGVANGEEAQPANGEEPDDLAQEHAGAAVAPATGGAD